VGPMRDPARRLPIHRISFKLSGSTPVHIGLRHQATLPIRRLHEVLRSLFDGHQRPIPHAEGLYVQMVAVHAVAGERRRRQFDVHTIVGLNFTSRARPAWDFKSREFLSPNSRTLPASGRDGRLDRTQMNELRRRFGAGRRRMIRGLAAAIVAAALGGAKSVGSATPRSRRRIGRLSRCAGASVSDRRTGRKRWCHRSRRRPANRVRDSAAFAGPAPRRPARSTSTRKRRRGLRSGCVLPDQRHRAARGDGDQAGRASYGPRIRTPDRTSCAACALRPHDVRPRLHESVARRVPLTAPCTRKTTRDLGES